jgi:hypothetical protein
MVPAQIIRSTACAPDQVRGIFAAVPIGKVQISEADDIDGILAQGQSFILRNEAGEAIGAYVLVVRGGEVWISAAAGRAGVDLTAAIAALVETQAEQFDSIAFQTKRRGLVKKTQRLGYQLAGAIGECGTIMRKTLK